MTQPGMTIVCGDSHTATHGAFGALAFGIGTSEVEHVLATQTLLFKPAKSMRVTINGTHHRVDLVFYHRILRCFVLIDLKLGDVQHHDIGQMNLYLGYFAKEENVEGDNPPIGIILSRQKDELLVEYATYGMSSQLFVQKYQLYLPERDDLRRELEDTLREAGR